MSQDQLRKRTPAFALAVIRFVEQLPRTRTADVLGRQLLRCATSVGANYRAACRARSNSEFVAKLGIVEEEADESIYWLELLVQAEVTSEAAATSLKNEASEILAMTVASINTARGRTR